MEKIEQSEVIQLLNYNINTSIDHLSIDGEKCVVNTINPHSYCIAKKDKEFHSALEQSDVLLPDGFGIVLAAKIIKGEKIKKIAGFDVFMHLMNELNEKNGSCFFLGASEKTLELIEQKSAIDFPNVTIKSYSPPYKKSFSEADSQKMCDVVNASNSSVVFIGMTAPKQEKWVYNFNDQLNTKIICSIGAVFDFYAGNVKRPSQFWIRLGLEWLPRFLKEPRRLAERNLVSTPKFLLEIVSYKLFNKGIL